jgi:hypothetical protein
VAQSIPMDWRPITTAPFDRGLELAVIDRADVHRLVFPCRRGLRGWVNALTGAHVEVYPTHWREWAGPIEYAPTGEPERERLDIVKEHADDLRAIIKKDGDCYDA